jgi:hypothetical protein
MTSPIEKTNYASMLTIAALKHFNAAQNLLHQIEKLKAVKKPKNYQLKRLIKLQEAAREHVHDGRRCLGSAVQAFDDDQMPTLI